ncbi:MAG: tRNA (adenosine(37)-N6)-threonylcarbamoyltransferase complex dimerization subunit type 1 TsaB [Solirubrobacteraceae bacterium]
MRILGFDTATAATTVAVLDTDAGTALERRDDPPPGQRPRHTTRLMGLVVAVMDAAGVDWEDIDRIAVGVGPGTFTGLRIGVATARALARARRIPLVGVSTLHTLARGAVPAVGPDEDAVIAVIDARRGEVFVAGWPATDVRNAAARPLLGPLAVEPAALADAMLELGRSWLAAGDGAVGFRTALERSGARIPPEDSGSHRVSAVELCRLAAGRRPQAAEGVSPEYLRLPDAEISLRATRQQ